MPKYEGNPTGALPQTVTGKRSAWTSTENSPPALGAARASAGVPSSWVAPPAGAVGKGFTASRLSARPTGQPEIWHMQAFVGLLAASQPRGFGPVRSESRLARKAGRGPQTPPASWAAARLRPAAGPAAQMSWQARLAAR